MGIKEPSFTLGVEEEYLLVDKETRSLVIDPPETLMAEAVEKCGSQVTPELLRSQIEIGTKVSVTSRRCMKTLRVCAGASSRSRTITAWRRSPHRRTRFHPGKTRSIRRKTVTIS